ncbi:MAG: hypothetical protein ACP5LN_08490 [Thermoproteota archaeon]
MSNSTKELIRFELERNWTATFFGFSLALLIVSSPINSAPLYAPSSIIEMALRSIGSFKPLILCFLTALTLANSFGRDMEQNVVVGELINPVKKETLFLCKLLANLIVLIMINFVSIIFSVWLTFVSVHLVSIFLLLVIETMVALLYASISIFISLITRTIFSSVLSSIGTYFLETIFIFTFTNYKITNPEGLFISSILSNQVSAITGVITLVHTVFALSLLVFSFFIFSEVLQFD